MPSEQEITVRFHPSAADYRKVLIWYRWKRQAVIFAIVLVGLLMTGLAFVTPTAAEPYKRLPIYLGVILTPIVCVFVAYLGVRKQARKLEVISEDTEFTFTRDGLHSRTSMSESTIKWERFDKVVETSKYFVFFPQHNVFYMVPKGNFDGDSQLMNFRSIVRDSLGDRAKLQF
jgi:hypothetical protein